VNSLEYTKINFQRITVSRSNWRAFNFWVDNLLSKAVPLCAFRHHPVTFADGIHGRVILRGEMKDIFYGI